MADIIEHPQPTGFEAVDGTWQFDLDFYREIGLNLAPLEDPTETAAMPRLRRAAELYITAKTDTKKLTQDQLHRAKSLLLNAHAAVGQLIGQAARGVHYGDVDAEHPAVIAWLEREAMKAEEVQRAPSDARFDQINRIHTGLVRERMPEIDPDYMKAKFSPIRVPGTNYYSDPTQVANQLTLARVGVWWDI